MDLMLASRKIEAHLRETFGKVLTLREVSIERRSSGRTWMGTAYCITQRGDIEVGKIGVTEGGDIVGCLSVDQLVNALMSVDVLGRVPEQLTEVLPHLEEDFSDITDDGLSQDSGVAGIPNAGDEEARIDAFFQDLDGSRLKGRIIGLLTSGRKEDLLEARKLMPKLLVEHAERGDVLRQMGELELRLGNLSHGLAYLEAAAREYADLADTQALEQIVALTADTLGAGSLEKQTARQLLDQTRARRIPMVDLSCVPAFKGLREQELLRLSSMADLVTVNEGTILLQEGARAVHVFVIQSGVLAIALEAPGGEARIVRCCLPGELVGESSLLDVESPTCNATVTVRERSLLWRFNGDAMKALLPEVPDLRARIEAKRTIHRLDSFFSMNEATNTLDVRVRDKLLSCISEIRHARAGEVLESMGADPGAVYLVVTGQVECRQPGVPPLIYGPDRFVCLKDTLHELPLTGHIVATSSCRLVTFNKESLRLLAAEAPPEVVAVLDRLE